MHFSAYFIICLKTPHGLKKNSDGGIERYRNANTGSSHWYKSKDAWNICAMTEYMTNDIMYLLVLALLIGGCISLGSHPT